MEAEATHSCGLYCVAGNVLEASKTFLTGVCLVLCLRRGLAEVRVARAWDSDVHKHPHPMLSKLPLAVRMPHPTL